MKLEFFILRPDAKGRKIDTKKFGAFLLGLRKCAFVVNKDLCWTVYGLLSFIVHLFFSP